MADTTDHQDLTQRQQEVLDFIVEYLDKHGYPPTLADMCDRFGWKSRNGSASHIRPLVRKGYLVVGKPGLDGNHAGSRTIQVVGRISSVAGLRAEVERLKAENQRLQAANETLRKLLKQGEVP